MFQHSRIEPHGGESGKRGASFSEPREAIESGRWTVVTDTTGPEDSQRQIAYTVGLAARNLPEGIVLGLEPGAARVLLDEYAAAISDWQQFNGAIGFRSAPPFRNGVSRRIGGAEFLCVEVPNRVVEAFCQEMTIPQNVAPHCVRRAIQLVWRDEHGRLPMDDKSSEASRAGQLPLLDWNHPRVGQLAG